ncbi:uncharacterized protein KD926_008316 [Aspergillus affinis]|uniref:uncharacterized protein n=1 Tax=Aspergillus affinis TaxID=1070780 RepID=UPI0022FEE119|nr:uncharacterized protein KD926_008316 [Aspergillus affinis]KAI9040359.1 hypothetical protein KD926_008316 [Aspergillus affinis]
MSRLRLGDIHVEYATEARDARQAERNRPKDLDKETNVKVEKSLENSPSASSSPGPPLSPGLQEPDVSEKQKMSHLESEGQIEESREQPEIQMDDLPESPTAASNSPRALSDSSPFTMNQLIKQEAKVNEENKDNNADENYMQKELPRDSQPVGHHKRAQSTARKRRKAKKKREKSRKRKHRNK